MHYPYYGTPVLFLCQAHIEFFVASAPGLLTCLYCLLTAGLHDELSQIQLDSSSYSNKFPEEPKKIVLTLTLCHTGGGNIGEASSHLL